MPGLMTICALVCLAIIFVGNYQPWLAAFLGLVVWALPYWMMDWEIHLYNRFYIRRAQLQGRAQALPRDAVW